MSGGATTVRGVVFDIGNVLVEWRPERLYAGVIPEPERRKRFFEEAQPDRWNDAGDRGDGPLEALVADAALRTPQWDREITRWWTDWPAMFQPAIEGSFALLRALKAKDARLFALSNFATDSFEIARRLYPALDEFEELVISGREKVMKPDERIYEILEERTGLSGDELFFTDDRADNCRAARERGWLTHRFHGPKGLAFALVDQGLLSPSELPMGL